MTFANIPEFDSNIKRAEYLSIKSGIPYRIRILDSNAHQVERHYIKSRRISVNCLGDKCPICQRNSELIAKNPNRKPSDISGYISKQYRFVVNILNRSMVKIAPSGAVTYSIDGKFPYTNTNGENISAIEPVMYNKVQVLERGISLFKIFNMIHQRNVDPDTGMEIGINNFDIELMAVGEGTSMQITATPLLHYNDVVEYDEEDLVDLSTTGIALEPDEINAVLDGASLKDVFSQRSRSDSYVENMVSTDNVPKETDGVDIASRVNNLLFN